MEEKKDSTKIKRAECPSASEKNAILRFTIIVPSIPNRGVMIITARNALRIKLYCHHPVKNSIIPSPPFQIPV